MHAIQQNHPTISEYLLKSFQWTSPQTPKVPQTYSFKAEAHRATPNNKTVKVLIEERVHEIPLPYEPVTCGWLLAQTQKTFEKAEPVDPMEEEKEVVAIRTESNNETLDYYLTLLDRTLPALSQKEPFAAVFSYKSPAKTRKTSKKNFELVKMIGKGGFSNVYEVRYKKTGNIYAMKVVEKEPLEKENKVQQVLNEKRIMEHLEHPFIVRLHWSFQSRKKLHFVMDFCAGGELFYHLHNVGRLTESQAKFYFAEIVLGIEYLHKYGIVYRDLKPENVLLDVDGHVRLADFGLSKEGITLTKLTHSFCGSPEYMSPEMLQQRGHTLTVDFYSLGALVYEMILGLPPHYSTNRDEMYKRILMDPVSIPSSLSPPLKDLLASLLRKNPARRLGAKRGIEEIKEHPWCRDINWDQYLNKKVDPPFKPSLRKSHFDPEYTGSIVEQPCQKTERSYSYYCNGSNCTSFLQEDSSESALETYRQSESKYHGFSFERPHVVKSKKGHEKENNVPVDDESIFSVAQEYDLDEHIKSAKVSNTPARKMNPGNLLVANVPDKGYLADISKSVISSPTGHVLSPLVPGQAWSHTQKHTPMQPNKSTCGKKNKLGETVEEIQENCFTDDEGETRRIYFQTRDNISDKRKTMGGTSAGSAKFIVKMKPTKQKALEKTFGHDENDPFVVKRIAQEKTVIKPNSGKKGTIERNIKEALKKIGNSAIPMSSQTPKATFSPLLFNSSVASSKPNPYIKILDGKLEADKKKSVADSVQGKPHVIPSRNMCSNSKSSKREVKGVKPHAFEDTVTRISIQHQSSFEKTDPATMHKACFDKVNKEQKKIQDFFNKVLKSNLVEPATTKAKATLKEDWGIKAKEPKKIMGTTKFAMTNFLITSKNTRREGSLESDHRHTTLNYSKDSNPIGLRTVDLMESKAKTAKNKPTINRSRSKKEAETASKRSSSSGKRLGNENKFEQIIKSKLNLGSMKEKKAVSGKVVLEARRLY